MFKDIFISTIYEVPTSRVINISHALVQCIQQVLFLLPRGHWRLDCLLPILINIIKIQSVLPLPT